MARDILLVVPPSINSRGRGISQGMLPPLGLGYLAAVLEAEKLDVGLVDMQAEGLRGAELGRLVRASRPRVVGISTMINTYRNGLRVAQLVKEIAPETTVIMGGPQATFLVEETLACPHVDIVARHEGEETLVEIMQHLGGDGRALEAIPGIAFRTGDGICQTERRPSIGDLDSLPFPARHLFKLDRYSKPGVLITARGCPSQCVFCAANTLYPDRSYRARSPHRVVDEIEQLVERFGLDSFFIADDTFTLQPARAMAVCDVILDRKLVVTWACEARVNTMSAELARRLRAAGCIEVQYGVETGNPDIMKLIRKGIKLEQVEQAVDHAVTAGLDVICSFIVGLPWDTWETVRQTIGLAQRLCQLGSSQPNRGGKGRGRVTAVYSPLTPLPGTMVYQEADALGLQFLTRDWDRFTFNSPVVETAQFSAAAVRQALYGAVSYAQIPC